MEEIKYSVSRYKLQLDCLGKYYFRYIKNTEVEKLTWPGTIFGSSIHKYIEDNLQKIDEIKKLTDYKKYNLPPFIKYNQQEKNSQIANGFKIGKPRMFNEDRLLADAEKWLPNIFRFLKNFLPKGQVLHEDEINTMLEINGVKINNTSIIDLQIIGEENKLWIFDFKNTKHPTNYFFINWQEDPQSVSYLYFSKEKNPQSFSYIVFDIDDSMIFVNSTQMHDNVEELFHKMINNFIINHQMAEDSKLYNPSKEKCKWCEFNKHCKKAMR
jgi:hypothetical protein